MNTKLHKREIYEMWEIEGILYIIAAHFVTTHWLSVLVGIYGVICIISAQIGNSLSHTKLQKNKTNEKRL